MTVCCWQQRQRPIAGTQITGRVTRGGGGPEALSGVADGHWSVGAGEEIWAIKLSLFRVFLQQCWQQYITFVHSRDKICRFLYDKVKSFFRRNYEMTISTS